MIRIFYAAGPGRVIDAHKNWRSGIASPDLIAMSYSGQFADFCQTIDAKVYMVSHASPEQILEDGNFFIWQKPKLNLGSSAIGYHLSQLVYGIWLFFTAVRFRANYAVIHSSSTHFFVLSLFSLWGIKVIPVLHNSLWPAGFPATGRVKRIIQRMDGYFFRCCAHATLGVSLECLRQVAKISGISPSSPRLIEIKGQFQKSYFDAIPPAPVQMHPFRIMFSGRINENKGVFDLLEIAQIIEHEAPGLVLWDVCGAGPELDELTRRCAAAGLNDIIEIHGHVLPAKMKEIIARNHASIVPTKSTFAEGLALSAVEPVLANRPVFINPVVCAQEALGAACFEARTDDVRSYVDLILKLARSPELYRSACEACECAKGPFVDGTKGFAAGLRVACNLS